MHCDYVRSEVQDYETQRLMEIIQLLKRGLYAGKTKDGSKYELNIYDPD